MSARDIRQTRIESMWKPNTDACADTHARNTPSLTHSRQNHHKDTHHAHCENNQKKQDRRRRRRRRRKDDIPKARYGTYSALMARTSAAEKSSQERYSAMHVAVVMPAWQAKMRSWPGMRGSSVRRQRVVCIHIRVCGCDCVCVDVCIPTPLHPSFAPPPSRTSHKPRLEPTSRRAAKRRG